MRGIGGVGRIWRFGGSDFRHSPPGWHAGTARLRSDRYRPEAALCPDDPETAAKRGRRTL